MNTTKHFTHPIDDTDEEMKFLLDFLHQCATDEEVRNELEAEHEAWETNEQQ